MHSEDHRGIAASDELLCIVEKLRRKEPITALDVHRLRQVAETLAMYCGYAGINDPDLLLDATNLLRKGKQP